MYFFYIKMKWFGGKSKRRSVTSTGKRPASKKSSAAYAAAKKKLLADVTKVIQKRQAAKTPLAGLVSGPNVKTTTARRRAAYGTMANLKSLKQQNVITGPADNDVILKTRTVGSYNKSKPNIAGALIKQMIDQQFPVVRQHVLQAPNSGVFSSLEWGSGFQAVGEIQFGYRTDELRQVLDIGNSAQYQYINTAAPGPNGIPNVATMTDQKVHVYGSMYKFNYKNNSTHTSYLELRVYKVKNYHGFTFLQSWNAALGETTMLPMVHATLSNTTDEAANDPGNRPKMSYAPELYTRFSEIKSWRQKYLLSPGQSTTYVVKLPEFRMNKAEFNCYVGGFNAEVDPAFTPYTYFIVAFAQSEMVVNIDDQSVNRAVTCGSGRIDINYEYWKSAQAIPYIKPLQTGIAKFWKELNNTQEGDMDEQTPTNVPYSAI